MILRLAHVEITVDDLAQARAFYIDILGFVEHCGDDSTCYLRAADEFDAWSLKITSGAGGGLVHSGFRVSDPADLDSLQAIHDSLGLATKRIPSGVEPGQGEALRVLTAEGHRVEFFHDFDEIDLYPGGRLRLPPRGGSGIRGVPPSRIDHVSMRVPDVPAALIYWTEQLEFSAAEIWLEDDNVTPKVAWVRRAPFSHDVALGKHPEAVFHHFAYAVNDGTALLRAADLLGDAGLQGSIEWGPSRHGATNALAMYVHDPAGNRLELYTGDYQRDLDRPTLRWRAVDYESQGHSWWGNGPPETFGQTQPLVGDWLVK